MVPHKSRKFRTILDLSFRLCHKGKLLPSVNSGTVKLAPEQAMIQLGNCMKRLVSTMADNYDPEKPFVFAKVDIKDGFWRLRVFDDEAWNFCYVMPQQTLSTSIDNTQIVVPNSLQMGWCESPPLFCAVTETARDVIESLLQCSNLPQHKFEYQMLERAENVHRLQAAAQAVNLLEVFVDNFIAATNDTSSSNLTTFSKAILHDIHSVFLPPEVSTHQGENPISQKKMKQGDGTWQTTKEILGWIVNDTEYTIQLPPSKCEKITKLIKATQKMKACLLQTYQEITGKIQHASFAVPGGQGLLSPLHAALKGTPPFVTITPIIKQTLLDWHSVKQHLALHPTPVSLLVPKYPNFIQYTDACQLSAGGVICPGLDNIKHTVWQFRWPKHIITLFDNNTITINDLKLAGMVLGWLVLEYVAKDLNYKHIGMFCDNTSAIGWTQKGHTTTSIPAARLLRFLSLRQRFRRTSSLLPVHIAGEQNSMADFCSRAFKDGKFHLSNMSLLTFFNSSFPLPQKQSWTEWTVHKKLSMRVISCVLGEQLQMESLLNLPKLKKNIGNIGCHTPTNSKPTHSSKENPNCSSQSSSQAMLQGSGQVLSALDMKSRFRQCLTPWRPSPRPLNWQENVVPSTKSTKPTSSQSKDASRASVGKTPQPSPN